MCTRFVAQTFIHTPYHHHALLVLCGRKGNKKSKRKVPSHSALQVFSLLIKMIIMCFDQRTPGLRRMEVPFLEKNPNAPRITSNVKQNMHVLKQQKVLDWPNSRTPKPITRFRRNKEKEKELSSEEDVHEDSPKLDDGKKKFKGKPVLLVDGYNVCGYWPKLKQHFFEGRLAQARQELLDELVVFSAVRDVKVVVVYDAMKSGRHTHKVTYQNIDVVYSAKSSADNWIKRKGAYVWSCESLIEKIEVSQLEYEDQIKHERFLELRADSMKRRILENSKNPGPFDVLKELKTKLEEYERNQTRSK